MNTLHKTILFFATTFTFGVFISACKPTNQPDKQYDRPAWAAVDTTDLESTMTITGVLPTTLTGTADSTDMVAAFAGNDCWGVTNIHYVNDQAYFFLFVNRPLSDANSFPLLTLRYYSTKTRYIYVEKNVCTFAVDAIEGTLEKPLSPLFATKE